MPWRESLQTWETMLRPEHPECPCDYPLMSLRPSRKDVCVLRRTFRFVAESPSQPPVQDAFHLEIEVPAGFPKAMPRVKETGGRIPPYGEYHVNMDRTLCLG